MEQERPRGKFARASSLWDIEKTAKIGDDHVLLARRLAGRPGEERDGPLLDAARRGAAGVARKLGESGANPNAFGARGRTALHLAALSGSVDTVRAVLEQGANKRIRDEANADAATLAKAIGNHRIARLIESWSSPYDDQVFGLGDAQPLAEPSAEQVTGSAIQLLESGIAQKRAVFGDRHAGLAPTLVKLGHAYECKGRLAEAAEAVHEACELAATPEYLFGLARLRMALREPKSAVAACVRGLALLEQAGSSKVSFSEQDQEEVLATRRRLMLALAAAQGANCDYPAQADSYRQVVHEIEHRSRNDQDPALVRPLVGLGRALGSQQAHRESAQVLARALRLADLHLPPTHADIAVVMGLLADALADAHEFEKAQALYRRVMEIQQTNRIDAGATFDRMASSIVRQHKLAKRHHRSQRRAAPVRKPNAAAFS